MPTMVQRGRVQQIDRQPMVFGVSHTVSPYRRSPPALNALACGFSSLTGWASAWSHSVQERTHRQALPLGHTRARAAPLRPTMYTASPAGGFPANPARVVHLLWLPMPRCPHRPYRHWQP